ncbi:MAG: ankyrin repeat domain-containing protein, partial [Synergistaceae bacterium]|nr:ankyrin repeat domain-containing protein [Synergistaceae bacterium]
HTVQVREENQENLDILDCLIAAGRDVETRDRGRSTPLMHAALRGKQETAQKLLEAGAKADATDSVGWTPLHFAARDESGLEVLRLLIESHNEVDIPDNGGTTPLMVAASYDNSEATQLLLNMGANVNRADNTGRNAYEYTVLKNASSAKRLLEEVREKSKSSKAP